MTSDLWGHVCKELRFVIGQDAYQNWIEPIQFNGCTEGVCHLAAPTPFIGNWVSQHYGERIQRLITDAGGSVQRLDFSVCKKEKTQPETVSEAADQPEPVSQRNIQYDVGLPAKGPGFAEPQNSFKAEVDLPGSPLDARYKFENFVVGKPNELAHAAARRVSEPGPPTFNPLFLYGGVGLGKTHLMHAIAWQIKETRPEARVLYLSAEQFMYRFVQALRFKDMHGFKQLFRSVDVLMVDDVQFIGGKDSTQEEFFHTFNALVDQQRQIVITSDRPPNEIQGIEDRIISRLQSGLVVDVHPTDYELRLGILHTKAEAQARLHPGIDVDQGVFEYLAMRISSNVRVLEGALTRLYAFASLVGRRIDMEMSQECLADVIRASERKVTIDEIIRKVAEHYNVRMADLLGPRRARSVSRPRQVAMFLSKSLTTKSLPEIGRRFGGRDHTTVIHAVRKVEELRAIDAQISDDVELLRRMLEA